MNNNSVMRLTCAALRCGFMVALLLIAALPALTQDTLSDADKCFWASRSFTPKSRTRIGRAARETREVASGITAPIAEAAAKQRAAIASQGRLAATCHPM